MRVVPYAFGSVGTEGLRDLRLRVDLFLDALGIEAVDEASLGVSRARCFIAGDITDGCLGGAALAIAVTAKPYASTLWG